MTAAILAAGGLALALRQAKRELPPRRVPLLGLGAAFVFAAQMVNFPVAGGTSGHLIGGALVVALLGLPARSRNQGSMASSASGARGVVALWSR